MALEARTRFLGRKSVYVEFRRSLNSPQDTVGGLRDGHFLRRAAIRFWSFQDNSMLTLFFVVVVSGSRCGQYFSSVCLLEVPLG